MPFLEWKNIHTEALHSCGLIWVIFSQLEPINIEHRWYLLLLRFPLDILSDRARRGGGGRETYSLPLFARLKALYKCAFGSMLFKLRELTKLKGPKYLLKSNLAKGNQWEVKVLLSPYFSIFPRGGSFLVPQFSWDTLPAWKSMFSFEVGWQWDMQVIRRPIRERIGGGLEISKENQKYNMQKKEICLDNYPFASFQCTWAF